MAARILGRGGDRRQSATQEFRRRPERRRQPPASPMATDAEAAQLFRGMVAYAGSYRIDGDKVLVHVDASWNRAWDGMDRPPVSVEVKGDRLTYKTAPFVSPFVGKQMVEPLIW